MKDSRQSPPAGKASSPWALRMKACVSPSNAKGKCFTFPRGFFHLSARLRCRRAVILASDHCCSDCGTCRAHFQQAVENGFNSLRPHSCLSQGRREV
jgi:hypothetical protein